MAHSVLVPKKIMASDSDSLNRVAVSASAIDNGWVMQLATRSATAGESEVWVGTAPAAGAGLKELWMAYSPEVVSVISGSNVYKGIDADPQNFYHIIGEMIDVFKPQLGDILLMTGDGFATGTGAASAFAVATNATFLLTWAAAAVSGLSLKYLATSYISKPTGTISDTQRVTAYLMEVSALA